MFLAAWLTSSLTGATIKYLTPNGSSVADGPVAADAIFDMEVGFATVTIYNDLLSTRSAGQLISGLEFRFDPFGGAAVLTSSSADLIQVRNNGSVADKGTGSTGWVLGQFGGGLVLCVVCPAGVPDPAAPSHEIIGPGPYDRANSSIAGSQTHNPLLNQVAVFTITNASISPGTIVNDVVFTFGTSFGSDLTTVRAIDPIDPVPEPEAYILVAAGFFGLRLLRRLSRDRKYLIV